MVLPKTVDGLPLHTEVASLWRISKEVMLMSDYEIIMVILTFILILVSLRK